MPKPISDEELQLKVRARRRIIGAIALVIMLVVLVPMLLDRQPKQEVQEVAINIPSPDKAPSFNPLLKSPSLPEKAKPTEQFAPLVSGDGKPSDAKPVEDVTKPTPAGEATNAVTKTVPTPLKPLDKPRLLEKEKTAESKKPPESSKQASAKRGKFAVQLGVFSNAENAQQVEERLSENKIRHYREMLKSPPGAIRVRAGPYPTRNEAESALTRLKLAGISGGVVVSE